MVTNLPPSHRPASPVVRTHTVTTQTDPKKHPKSPFILKAADLDEVFITCKESPAGDSRKKSNSPEPETHTLQAKLDAARQESLAGGLGKKLGLPPGFTQEEAIEELALQTKMRNVDQYLKLTKTYGLPEASTRNEVIDTIRESHAPDVREKFGLPENTSQKKVDAAIKESHEPGVREKFGLPKDAPRAQVIDIIRESRAPGVRKKYGLPKDAPQEDVDAAIKMDAGIKAVIRESYEPGVRQKLGLPKDASQTQVIKKIKQRNAQEQQQVKESFKYFSAFPVHYGLSGLGSMPLVVYRPGR